MPTLRRHQLLLALALVLLPVSAHALAPPAEPDFDHSIFNSLLAAHVDEAGRVDYAAFAASRDFDRYLESLAGADLSLLNEQERLALWINAYNAWTIRLINREGETESIRNINKTFGFISSGGAWKVRLARVASETWTLDEIEHEIIRERFTEPRIHFALVCAAIGCPPLRQEAFTGAALETQLDDQARRFLVATPEKNRVDVSEGRVYLSPIFDWFEDDFGGSRASVGQFVARWYPRGPSRTLLESGSFRIEYTEYDWSLNRQSPPS